MNHTPKRATEKGKDLYTVFPKQSTDTAETMEFIKSTVNNHDLHPWTDVHEQLMSWTVEASPSEVTQLEGHDGIDRVTKLEIPKHHKRVRQDDSLQQKSTIYPVDGRNLDQCNATSASLKALLDGKVDGPRIWDGRVEGWVALLTKAQVEQVEAIDGVKVVHPVHKAIDNHEEPGEDDEEDDPSHGTCSAGKALGTQFGASKKAMLVVVRLYLIDTDEFKEALDLIIHDLDEHPERRKKSVITMPLSIGQDWEDGLIDQIRGRLNALFDRDVPFVCNSGNIDPVENDSEEVNEYPALLEGPDFPLIVVGSVNSEGALSDFSQRGPHDSQTPMRKDGTSFAAPLVAGEIANLLSYETVPFDTSDGSLVKNLKAYLQSDKGSWERVPGIRVLWNGVTEETHNSKEHAQCNTLQADFYVERDDVKSLIENEFCPDATVRRDLQQDSFSISRTYNEGTPNKVTLSMDLETGSSVKHNGDDCINQPANYKAGGLITIGGDRYRVSPGTLRSAAEKGKQAGCDSAYKVFFNEYWVWGHGWASSDNGKSLQDEVKSCALLPDTWSFEYGLGDDGREWTAKFRTGVFQKSCVGNALKTAAGIDGVGCHGSG
ncbi:hypothetical protein MRS44_004359 [Fusarium solani]|uniref:uncharacterized protein n=1 Tax=Fusarium solani TaxID=169388 RepID=UPI0032C456B7|nr:hypothetical protein MRS44_004359 [Fusarium solani]